MALLCSWLTWLAVAICLNHLLPTINLASASGSSLGPNCIYQECAQNPLAECHFSSDYLINCENREACQRIIVFKTIPEGPLAENLSISLHGYYLKPNQSIDLTLDVSYLIDHYSVAFQQFTCQYSRDNNSASAVMTGFNDTQVNGDAHYNGEYIHCQWLITPNGSAWPVLMDGKPVNLYHHVFTRNQLTVNRTTVLTFHHSPPIQRLRYITDTLYPKNGLPFNPCQLSGVFCSGRVIIVPNHQDETYLDIFLIVFDPIKGINLQLRHSPNHNNIGLLRCRSEESSVQCRGILEGNDRFVDPPPAGSQLIGGDYQLGSAEAVPLFNSQGLRAFWRVPVSFAQLWNYKDPDGVDFLLDIHIWLDSGDLHNVRGKLKVPIARDYPSPLDQRKCSTTDASSHPSFMSSPGAMIYVMLTIVLAQLLH